MRFDEVLFRFLNQGLSNPALDLLMCVASALATREFFAPMALILLLSKKKETRMLGLLLIAGLTVQYFTVNILKELITRPRPIETLRDVTLIVETAGFSLPSGHATNAFMAAYLFSSVFKRHIVFYGLALMVGISRVYLGAHYPLDVLAGMAVGIAIGYVLTKVAKSIEPTF